MAQQIPPEKDALAGQSADHDRTIEIAPGVAHRRLLIGAVERFGADAARRFSRLG